MLISIFLSSHFYILRIDEIFTVFKCSRWLQSVVVGTSRKTNNMFNTIGHIAWLLLGKIFFLQFIQLNNWKLNKPIDAFVTYCVFLLLLFKPSFYWSVLMPCDEMSFSCVSVKCEFSKVFLLVAESNQEIHNYCLFRSKSAISEKHQRFQETIQPFQRKTNYFCVILLAFLPFSQSNSYTISDLLDVGTSLVISGSVSLSSYICISQFTKLTAIFMRNSKIPLIDMQPVMLISRNLLKFIHFPALTNFLTSLFLFVLFRWELASITIVLKNEILFELQLW